MEPKAQNGKLNRAKERRDDEYYTLRADVDAEMEVYAAQGLDPPHWVYEFTPCGYRPLYR